MATTGGISPKRGRRCREVRDDVRVGPRGRVRTRRHENQDGLARGVGGRRGRSTRHCSASAARGRIGTEHESFNNLVAADGPDYEGLVENGVAVSCDRYRLSNQERIRSRKNVCVLASLSDWTSWPARRYDCCRRCCRHPSASVGETHGPRDRVRLFNREACGQSQKQFSTRSSSPIDVVAVGVGDGVPRQGVAEISPGWCNAHFV